MKHLTLILLAVFMSATVAAQEASSVMDDVQADITDAFSGSDKLWSISAGAGFVDTSFTISGESSVTINTEPVLLGSIAVMLFPDSLKLELSYGATVGADSYLDTSTTGERRGGENSSEVEYLNVFTKPFETRFGDFGYGYQKYQYNALLISGWGNGSNIWDLPTDVADAGSQLVLNVGDRYGSQIKYERISMIYNLPEFSWLVKGTGITYAIESGNRIQLTDINSLAAMADYDGTRIGLGIYRTTDELKEGFSWKTLELFRFTYESDFLNLSTNSTDTLTDGDVTGWNLELAYKKSFDNKSVIFMLYGEVYEDKFADGRSLAVSTGGLSANMEWAF